MTLSEFIKQYRKDHGLSQRQFASVCKVSNGYISMLEKGENPKTGEPITPSPQTIQAISRGMGMTMQQLLSEVEELYIDLTGEKQPVHVGGLSIDTMEIAEIIETLPAEKRRELLLRVREMRQATPDPGAPAKS